MGKRRYLLNRLINASIDGRPQAEQLAILQKLPALYDLIFEQGDHAYYNAPLAWTYLKIAALSEDSAATEMLARAQRCAQNYDRQTDALHTSLLFRDHPITPSEWTKPFRGTMTEWLADEINQDDRLKSLWQKA